MYKIVFITKDGVSSREYTSLDEAQNAVSITPNLVSFRCWQVSRRRAKKKFEKFTTVADKIA